MTKKKSPASSLVNRPVVVDEDGTPRFKENKMVAWMWRALKRRDPHVMADMLEAPFSADDRGEFFQLIGYTTSGYSELFGVPKESIDAAEAEALRLME